MPPGTYPPPPYYSYDVIRHCVRTVYTLRNVPTGAWTLPEVPSPRSDTYRVAYRVERPGTPLPPSTPMTSSGTVYALFTPSGVFTRTLTTPREPPDPTEY